MSYFGYKNNGMMCYDHSDCTSSIYEYCRGGVCVESNTNPDQIDGFVNGWIVISLIFAILAYFRPLRDNHHRTPLATGLSVLLAGIFFPGYLVGLIMQNRKSESTADCIVPTAFCCMASCCCGPICLPCVYLSLDYKPDDDVKKVGGSPTVSVPMSRY